MPLTEQQKIKLLKRKGAKWYVDLMNEIKNTKEEKKPGDENAKVLQD